MSTLRDQFDDAPKPALVWMTEKNRDCINGVQEGGQVYLGGALPFTEEVSAEHVTGQLKRSVWICRHCRCLYAET